MCIDTDGNIGISKNQNRGYAQYLRATNTNFKRIQWLLDNFGGNYIKREYDNDAWKDQYLWSIFGFESYKLLKNIRPYLLLKQEQADTAIELYEKVSKWHYGKSKPIPKAKKDLQIKLYQNCRVLNKKGKPEEHAEQPKLIRKTIKVTETLEEYL